MAVTFTIAGGILSLIFGLLVLAFPKFLRFIIGIYFIIVGLIGIFAGL